MKFWLINRSRRRTFWLNSAIPKRTDEDNGGSAQIKRISYKKYGSASELESAVNSNLNKGKSSSWKSLPTTSMSSPTTPPTTPAPPVPATPTPAEEPGPPPPLPSKEEENDSNSKRKGVSAEAEPEPTNKKKEGVSGESYNMQKIGNVRDIKLPKHEKDPASVELIRSAIRSNEFLKEGLDSKEVIEKVVDAMYLLNMPADSHIITEGEKNGSHLYVCAKGTFEVYKGTKKVNTLGPGRVFGELALLYNSPRNATIIATTPCSLWVLDRKVFHYIMMKSGLQKRDNNVKFLRSVPLLRKLDRSILERMSDLLKVEFFPTATAIIKQGDEGSQFYIISGGTVIVTINKDGKEEKVGSLKKGDYFGERALLNDDKRMATVTAESPGVECLTLDRNSFIELLGNLEDLKGIVISKEHRQSDNETKVSEYEHVSIDNLRTVGTLGVGGFGRVELVVYKKDPKVSFALKKLKKVHIVELQQQTHVFNEKAIMMNCRSPFIARLYKTYRDSRYLYFLMEACLGGDVWTVLQKRRFFDENTSRFMSACVVEAFEYLHLRGIVYRDLKPENLLLDSKGYVKLVDFGFAKKVETTSKTWTFAGTPEYLAPEIILNKGHDRAVDYWALGVFIHELMVGRPPFRGTDHLNTYNLILRGIDLIQFPKHVSKIAQLLIKKLCRSVPTERLGYQRDGVAGIKNHRWFQEFDWEALQKTTMTAPIQPSIGGPTDLRNFDTYPSDKENPQQDITGWDKDF